MTSIQRKKAVIEKLKKKRAIVGGSGILRRRKKGRSSLNTAAIKERRRFETLIDKLNACLLESEYEKNQDITYAFVEEYITDFLIELKKQDIHPKSKEVKSIRFVRTNYSPIMNQLFHSQDTLRFLKKYTFIQKNFTRQGYISLLITLDSLYNELLKKTYLEEDAFSEDDDTEQTIQIHLKRLGLSLELGNSPTITELKQAYFDKTFEYHPDQVENRKQPEKCKLSFIRIQRSYKKCMNYFQHELDTE
jgi:hypothetical protein